MQKPLRHESSNVTDMNSYRKQVGLPTYGEEDFGLSKSKARREAKDQSQANKKANFRNHVVKPAALIASIGALATGVVEGPKVINNFNENNAQEAKTYDGPYAIPAETDPHRALHVNDKRAIKVGSKTVKVTLSTVDGIANYIHDKNPLVSVDEAKDLIQAENTRDQEELGVPQDKVDANNLAPNQEIRLPIEYGVGELVMPDNNLSTK